MSVFRWSLCNDQDHQTHDHGFSFLFLPFCKPACRATLHRIAPKSLANGSQRTTNRFSTHKVAGASATVKYLSHTAHPRGLI